MFLAGVLLTDFIAWAEFGAGIGLCHACCTGFTVAEVGSAGGFGRRDCLYSPLRLLLGMIG